MEKQCSKCKKVKDISGFSKHKAYKNGFRSECKICSARRSAKWYIDNKEHNRIVAARHYQDNKEYYVERHAQYHQENKEHLNEYQIQYRQDNPEKKSAHSAINNSIVKGSIIRPDTCSKCGMDCKPDAHHSDYSKPLDVTWLCPCCHRRLHAEMNLPENHIRLV